MTGIVVGEADVVGQRIEPHIGDKIFVERKLNSPVEPRFRTRDAEIADQFLDSISQFCLTKTGNDSVLAIIEVRQKPIPMLT